MDFLPDSWVYPLSLASTMIIRLSQEMARKRKLLPLLEAPPAPDPLVDWSCREFRVGRHLFWMASHTSSLYSVLMRPQPSRTSADFARRILDQVADHAQTRGYARFASRLRTDRGDTRFAKALNRRVTGSINELTGFAMVFIESPEDDLKAVSDRLNTLLFSILGKKKNDYGRPRDTLESLLAGNP